MDREKDWEDIEQLPAEHKSINNDLWITCEYQVRHITQRLETCESMKYSGQWYGHGPNIAQWVQLGCLYDYEIVLIVA